MASDRSDSGSGEDPGGERPVRGSLALDGLPMGVAFGGPALPRLRAPVAPPPADPQVSTLFYVPEDDDPHSEEAPLGDILDESEDVPSREERASIAEQLARKLADWAQGPFDPGLRPSRAERLELVKELTKPAPAPPADSDSEIDARRSLAQRLAAEAKARTAAVPSPPQPHTARKSATAKKSATARKRAPAPKQKLSSRAKRPVSAQEALRLAIAAESEEAEQAHHRQATERRRERDEAARSNAGHATTRARRLLADLFPGARIDQVAVVLDRRALREQWLGMAAEAARQRDPHGVAMTSVLLDAAGRVPDAALVAATIRWNAEPVVVWLDVERSVLLGASPR